MNFDWTELAFGSKKPVRQLKAIFIAAPRELSAKRFAQLVKTYLPEGNLVIGLAKENYIDGFAEQPQFRSLHAETIQPIMNKVNASASRHKLYSLHYFQREITHLIAKLDFQKVILVNGSWHYSFHTRPEYYSLANGNIPFEMVSPFTDEKEAQSYANQISQELVKPYKIGQLYASSDLMAVAQQAAQQSFDYCFQTGALLAKPVGQKYRLLSTACNEVIPYRTFAMHHGASREQNFSPPQDLNHYDTAHAEVELIVQAQKANLPLQGTTLCVNLMPCPPCARMLCRTDITEVIYAHDHSDGYAINMLTKAGKTVRRLVPSLP